MVESNKRKLDEVAAAMDLWSFTKMRKTIKEYENYKLFHYEFKCLVGKKLDRLNSRIEELELSWDLQAQHVHDLIEENISLTQRNEHLIEQNQYLNRLLEKTSNRLRSDSSVSETESENNFELEDLISDEE
jgi:hypothetical protein